MAALLRALSSKWDRPWGGGSTGPLGACGQQGRQGLVSKQGEGSPVLCSGPSAAHGTGPGGVCANRGGQRQAVFDEQAG